MEERQLRYARGQYEVFGKELDEIAKLTGIPLARLIYESEANQWVQYQFGQNQPIHDVVERLSDEVQQNIQVERIYADPTIASEILDARLAIVQKARILANSLSRDDEKAPQKIKALADAVDTLSKNTLLRQQDEQKETGNRIQVNIMGNVEISNPDKFGDTQDTSTSQSAVEVTEKPKLLN